MKIKRAVTRETNDRDPIWRLPLMVRLSDDGFFLEIWQKKRRKHFRLRYESIWALGYKMEMAAIRDAKKKETKQRRGR